MLVSIVAVAAVSRGYRCAATRIICVQLFTFFEQRSLGKHPGDTGKHDRSHVSVRPVRPRERALFVTAGCARCSSLYLHVNQLSGTIPSTLGNMTALA
jgi:hypothetical protein